MTIPRSLKYLPLFGVFSLALSLAYVLKLAASNASISNGPVETVRDFIPIVYVITATIIMYYIFLFHQGGVGLSELNRAKSRGKMKVDDFHALNSIKYGSDNIDIIAANRLVGNFNEQVIPFLISLYLHATFVSVKGAYNCGWAWVFFRSYYGYVYKKGLPILFFSTLPAYCCVWYMIGGTIYEISSTD